MPNDVKSYVCGVGAVNRRGGSAASMLVDIYRSVVRFVIGMASPACPS